MKKKILVTILVVLSLGSQLPAYAQERIRPIALREFVGVYAMPEIDTKLIFPVYNYKEINQQDPKQSQEGGCKGRRGWGSPKCGKFWMVIAAAGGLVAGIAVAVSSSSSDSPTLPVPYIVMGPIDKN